MLLAYLYAGSSLLLEQHVLWLHVTVYDSVLVQCMQALQQTVGKFANELQGEPLELVLLYQLV